MKLLPIGISTLSNIRSKAYIYIDKTHHLGRMRDRGGKYFFLSRPRRFGKSLLIDTIKQAFLANKDLFKGLYLENHWDWSTKYPVVHLSFGAGSAYKTTNNLIVSLTSQFENHAKLHDIELSHTELTFMFDELISKIYMARKKPVVILIDEYDKPILDVVDEPDEAKLNREILKSVYSVIKERDAELEFVFLTGVSKFNKVSLFSGLNNLDDISLDPNYADICGYTHNEVKDSFSDYLNDGKVDLVKLKAWYNGYNFAGLENQKVYNPYDLLLFCAKGYEYQSYWFETATPSFLIKLIKQNQYFFPKLEKLKVLAESISSFDIETLPLTTLLFQTGYLTIDKIINTYGQYGYQLNFPNLEVKSSLNAHLMALGTSAVQKNETIYGLMECFEENDFAKLKTILNAHFASIPHDWYRNNPMGQYEGFYASIVYSMFAAIGVEMKAEDATNIGKIDLSVQLPDKILIIEFKLKKYGSAQEAIHQIIEKGYAKKFAADKRPKFLIGISFDEKSKTVFELKWQSFALR